MTRSRIQAHSSNGGRVNPRDEGTTGETSSAAASVMGGFLNGSYSGFCPESAAPKARGSAVSATRGSRAGSDTGVSGTRRFAEPLFDSAVVRRWDDRFYAGRDGEYHGSILCGRRGNPVAAAERSGTAVDEPVHGNGNSGREIYHRLLAFQ